MPRFVVRATVAVALLTTACTQPPVQIQMKGQNTFSRETDGYASNSYIAHPKYDAAPVYNNPTQPVVSQATQQTASVSSIGVSDLPPPSQAAAKPAVVAKAATVAKPVVVAKAQPAKPVVIASNEVPTGKAPINKWTGRPHFSDTASVASNQDSIVSSDTPKVTKAATKTKTAVVASSDSLIWPVNSKKIISGFGPKGAGKVNDGINIAAAEGEPVWAAGDGEVVYVGNELEGYGNMVIIKHAGNKNTTYAHMSRANVEKYDRVKQGDIIGYVGSTGNVKGSQLHFALRNGKDPVDPRKYLSRNVASN